MSTVRAKLAHITVLALCFACGGPKVAPAPEYTPVNSPEAKTQCPQQFASAKTAREATLGESTPQANGRASRAVLAHADCERAHFDAHGLAAASYEALLVNVQMARGQYQNAKILYEEVTRYKDHAATIAAHVRIGDLHAAYADKLRKAPPPSQMRAPAQRAEFIGEMDEMAQVLDKEASRSWKTGVDAASVAPDLLAKDEQVKNWAKSACRSLRRLGASPHPICSRL